MGILIGMDEAGYGPNLGPLAVAATAWHVDDDHFSPPDPPPDEVASATGRTSETVALLNPKSAIRKEFTRRGGKSNAAPDLYRLLRNIVSKSPSERRVPIADSKALYNPAAGLRQLERGLHAVLLAMQQSLRCWSEIIQYCGADPDSHHNRVCWPDDFNCSLPIHATADELARLGTRFDRACQSAGVRPLFVRARLVFPQQFNELTAHFGNKASALSHVTIGLLREVVDTIGPQPPIHAVCDKHGGRNFYTAILQHHFSEYWIAPVFESHSESHYEWGEPDARTRVVFRMNGERFMPTALASMTAKYLRELSMKAFNEYWCARVPNLRPTAGYYGDSRRFKKAIESKQRELRIDEHLIWRER
jgi:ribonuclease HII